MTSFIYALIYPFLLIGLSIFVINRLSILRAKGAEGGGYVYSGLLILFLASIINLLQAHPEFNNWFLSGVYPVIMISKIVMIIAGAILFIIGLVWHFNFYGDRDIEVTNHLEKLRLLDTIQQESRYPYPLLELLDRVLKSLLTGLGEQSGAIFMLNRSQRKFVLATGSGLNRDETALLEYYPFGRNIVTQAIEDESPLISNDFRSLGGKAQLAASRFKSILVVPIISGRNKLGAMVLLSTEERHYDNEILSIIVPISEWLAEKIEVNRLNRDIHKVKNELDFKNSQLSNLTKQLSRIMHFDGTIPSPADFAERCLGLVESDEVWLIGLVNGRLVVHGGTFDRPDFTDNFRSALVNSINKGKPLILNQEGSDESGNKFITKSTLLIPVYKTGNAVLLRKSGEAIQVSGDEMQMLDMVASLAGLIVTGSNVNSISGSRRKGIKIISDALKLKLSDTGNDSAMKSLATGLAQSISPAYTVVLYKNNNKRLTSIYCSDDPGESPPLTLELGEGTTGKAAALRTDSALFEPAQITDNIESFHDDSRNSLNKLFGNRMMPIFMGDYAVIIRNETAYVMTVFGFEGSSEMHTEQHRLLSLLSGLINLRFEMTVSMTIPPPSDDQTGVSASKINEINNGLSAIMGQCQMALQDPNNPGATVHALDHIVETIEEMSTGIKKVTVEPDQPGTVESTKPDVSDLVDIIRRVFSKNAIYGNLYKVGERAISVNLKLANLPPFEFGGNEIEDFFNSACREFTRYVEEDDILTISTYSRKGYSYIDICRHKEKFPPVEQVAGFGVYQSFDKLDEQIRMLEFSEKLARFNAEIAYDQNSRVPSYFSFRFIPVTVSSREDREVDTRMSVLAVDDQAIILDLLAAMCQSLGYKIFTARDGEEGLKLFENYRPDIVISDLAMPRMSGWDLARKIKAISPDVPFVIITGWGVPVDQDKMAEIGIDHLLHKPFRLEQLADLMAQIKVSRANS